MLFSAKTMEILQSSGWSATYKAGVSEYIKVFMEEDYFVNELVINFLSQFGGLTIEHPAYRVPKKTANFHFNPIKAINHINKERVETYEERINTSLVVIGEAYNEHLILMMTPSGGIYGALDEYLTFLGNNPKEAIEALCEGKETPEIL
ncbi:SUKH-3 immunity protein of toxin-antitoxin system [Paenibacillus sp. BK033]|uniref:SUKH-3 domain-containing protein n=1 Tax=Paenibacillus sp. BK033 TaxID=2512133 RepID=UPI00104BF9CD|nr:SUKH-3 domain-containing protein [Paenibacillus sp. BK033]TCM99436.1 SUKH-3 immunity protein of toxin-antitoxin system [Paenibacillus sp. BK033]